ncbi:MAG: DNA polymerase III subunit alpha [Bacteroidia bacterium]|nr:DNA polymerase III subunit alpha [Bacteroidia bacterium]
MPDFSHLHCHTQFSLLDGAASISNLYKKAVSDGQRAVAITDHGNMFGVFNFVAEAAKHNKGEHKIKAIVGCEFYMVEDRHRKTFTKDDKDVRHHQLLLAKNPEGYKNLSKLCSMGYIEGMYSKWPRIDKSLIEKYHKGLIATSCCLGAIVPKTIMKKGEAAAEEELKWWLDLFGDDYYIELQRHGMGEQDKVNEVLMRFAKKFNLKVIATNDSHYVDKEDYNAHDILLCVNTGEKQSTPKMNDLDGDDDKFVKGKRFAFPNDNFYFKTKDEMSLLFSDIPEALENTGEIVDKIEPLSLKKDILLPNFPVPPEFATQDDFLESMTWEGAKKRYGEIDTEIEERLKFELFTIRTMGFAGYFLIVSDFIKAGRELGVVVGPGRGSAAGSAVAYCIGITNIDPIKYDLLFERFLNQERKSMPDIDTDFDDEGRQKVIDYVVDKYGRNQVAQIVTYGKMAAKMSLKDVARVMDLDMNESNSSTRLVPARPLGLNLKQIINAKIEGVKEDLIDVDEEIEGEEERDTILLRQEDIPGVMQLREWHHDKNNKREGEVLRQAMLLEGSVRNTGVHAAGIIIAPMDLTDIVPVAVAKDTNLLLTQFEGKVIEDAGVIKMDFLGLKTLSIIKTAMDLIKKNHAIDIDIDNIPLDDLKTFELYQRADTTGTFQFESPGMQKYLKELKPDKFEDLIAMNALYRPGPMEYIPTYIRRKHGLEEVEFDIPELKEYLDDTYGITVYQEQVMLLSQSLAGFSKGKADSLRKAMGKKNLADLMKLKDDFMQGIGEKGLDPIKCDKIWKDWEAFASYAFNKSHSTCYAFVAYQTGYLKAHYPAEYMAAVLSNNSNNTEKISLMMQECKRIGVPVLGPDVNESDMQFSVNSKGEIRFGLCAVKGVGEAPASNIIEERNNNGVYKNIFDLCARCNLRAVNKKTLEALAKGGAFDYDKNIHKAQYLAEVEGGSGIEIALKYGARTQESSLSNQGSLFGESTSENYVEPQMPKVEEYSILEECNIEKEMVGIFINRHPMDTFKVEYHALVNTTLIELENIGDLAKTKPNLIVAGIVVKVDNLITKTGKNYSKFILQDYSGQYTFFAFGKTFDILRLILYVNHFIVLRCKIEPPRWQKEGGREWELNILSGEKMEEVKDRYIKGINMNFEIQHLNRGIIEDLEDIFKKFAGTMPVNFTITDKEKRHQFELAGQENKVDICPELLDELKRNAIEFNLVMKN